MEQDGASLATFGNHLRPEYVGGVSGQSGHARSRISFNGSDVYHGDGSSFAASLGGFIHSGGLGSDFHGYGSATARKHKHQ